MTVYIAFLRGINVGGNKKVSMAELKISWEQIGVQQVKTYINSGNVLFTSNLGPDELVSKLEAEVESHFQLTSKILIRTAAELEQIVEQCPFPKDQLEKGESIHITLLDHPLSEGEQEVLYSLDSQQDEFKIYGDHIYFYFRQSILDSKLASFLSKNKGRSTSRNFNTMLKMHQLAEQVKESYK
ncbi:uncharacterized protein (DUF1697 family) [Paenibacillus shirakamiensis]|uniref:Uncharacterized protein (DUF1697 family) n=1 Tax=Paenibacillus shirakamiensis TaxID=1265935 RepID=A0ABS4JGU5_9BACL|nr:DUF1697 domain-containing protein [Paenibacillus shirakamiensis]MBP2000326.1 uncharacterized protein (DUF1697 family) [Paenibacillus shirakamiensis]